MNLDNQQNKPLQGARMRLSAITKTKEWTDMEGLRISNHQTNRSQATLPLSVIALFLLTAVLAPRAEAGCGCEKAPPDAASVRPSATYPETELTIFHPNLEPWQGYNVIFTSGVDGSSHRTGAEAIERRDLADGLPRLQLVVSVPYMPLGPTAISVTKGKGKSIETIAEFDDSVLTIVAPPIPVGSTIGNFVHPGYQAAVGRDGTLYVSLDMTGTTHARGLRAQALGYPLRFTSSDIVFYNTQGFLMQLLGEDMPGLYSLAAPDSANDSDVLEYARHEFNTYYVQHLERQEHGIDPADANWHLDGTPHIDHDHLILAIAGSLESGAIPESGSTSAFDLSIEVISLFHHGLVGTNSVSMSVNSSTDSYNSLLGPYGVGGNVGSQGDVRSNGLVAMSQSAVINGDAAADTFELQNQATITGSVTAGAAPTDFPPVTIPGGLVDIGNLSVGEGEIRTVVGPGSYLVSGIDVAPGGELLIDNADGPVTLYVTGDIAVASKVNDKEGQITTVIEDPEEFAIYVAAGRTLRISGNGNLPNGAMHGVLFAPHSTVRIDGMGQYYGAVVGGDVTLTGEAKVHFDTALRQANSDGDGGVEGGSGGGGKGGGGKSK